MASEQQRQDRAREVAHELLSKGAAAGVCDGTQRINGLHGMTCTAVTAYVLARLEADEAHAAEVERLTAKVDSLWRDFAEAGKDTDAFAARERKRLTNEAAALRAEVERAALAPAVPEPEPVPPVAEAWAIARAVGTPAPEPPREAVQASPPGSDDPWGQAATCRDIAVERVERIEKTTDTITRLEAYKRLALDLVQTLTLVARRPAPAPQRTEGAREEALREVKEAVGKLPLTFVLIPPGMYVEAKQVIATIERLASRAEPHGNNNKGKK